MEFCTISTISTHTPIPPSSHLYRCHSTLPNRILHITCWTPPLPYTLTSMSSFNDLHPSLCVSYTSHHLDLSPTFWPPLESLQISLDNLPQPNKRFINHHSCISSHVRMPLKTCSWDGFMRCRSSLKSKYNFCSSWKTISLSPTCASQWLWEHHRWTSHQLQPLTFHRPGPLPWARFQLTDFLWLPLLSLPKVMMQIVLCIESGECAKRCHQLRRIRGGLQYFLWLPAKTRR